MKLVLLGAPGAGKGTQAEAISDKLNIPVIGTGNIIREAIKNETEMGNKAKGFIDDGLLVPDDVIIQIIKERLALTDCNKGFILDGAPRTVAQAEILDQIGVHIDKVIDLEIADDTIVKRLTGRRVCSACGASYHTIYKPSERPNACDRCGGPLIIRKDDEPATILERLRVYHEFTAPLVGYYKERGILLSVESQEEVEKTTQLVFEKLGV